MTMDREARLGRMIKNYGGRRRDLGGEIAVMEFHRENLIHYLDQFRQVIAHFSTPSSRVLSHDFFLIIEAATVVARSDWEKLDQKNAARYYSFSKYFETFDQLREGLLPLKSAASACAEALAEI